MQFDNDNYHVGHLLLDVLKRRPDAVCQIDAATGESETNASVLARSVQFARCLRRFGVTPGDVLALGGRNHLDLHIPYYAALFNGMPIAGVDPQFKYHEIRTLFQLCTPRIAFCQAELLADYLKVVRDLNLDTRVICFDDGDYSMKNFIQQYDDGNDDEEFVPTAIDQDKVYCWLVSTGGTTGVVKLAAIKHKTILSNNKQVTSLFKTDAALPNDKNAVGLYLSPVQWASAFFNALSMPVMQQTKLQTSAPATTEHIIDVINKYRPNSAFVGPSLIASILKSGKHCDLSSMKRLVLAGGKVHKDIYQELRKIVPPEVPIVEAYGQTENMGPVLKPIPFGPIGSCGKAIDAWYQVKLVDPETGKDITEPNVPGEMWTKGLGFTEYYNNPKATAEAFSEDGWYKTGDLLYRDEEGNYFFVERISMLIKYRSYHVVPLELEAILREHPGVYDVSVTSIPHKEDGEHPVACVVKKPGAQVTAQEIKDLIADRMSDSQKLRGGVVFLEEMPHTSTGKIARAKLRELVLTATRE